MECYSPKYKTHLASVAEAMWFQEPTKSKDLDWSFVPILRLLRLIGVDLNSYESPSIRQRVYQLSLFGCNVLLQVAFVFHLAADDKKESVWIVGKQKTLTFYWTFMADMINISLNAVVTHFLLLFYVGKRWKNLKDSIETVKEHVDAHFEGETAKDERGRGRLRNRYSSVYNLFTHWMHVIKLTNLFLSQIFLNEGNYGDGTEHVQSNSHR